MLVRMCNLVDIEKEEMFDPDMKMKNFSGDRH
jgi:hypothetical protein